MPKTIRGIFIKCEKSVKKIIDKMHDEEKDIIAKPIDECCCIINPHKYKKVIETIEKLQNQFFVEPTDSEK